MSARAHPLYFWIFLLILAPLGAVVVISALLPFGVTPSVVFAPGNVIKSLLETGGLHVANRVAVARRGCLLLGGDRRDRFGVGEVGEEAGSEASLFPVLLTPRPGIWTF